MSRDDDGGTSFDPRSWNKPADVPAEREVTRAPTSFDPRTWSSEPTAVPGGSLPPAPPPRPLPTPEAPRPPYLGATLSSLAILLAGAALAWSMRAPPVRPAASTVGSSAAGPVQPPPATPAPIIDASRRTLNVASVDQIADTLAASGVPPEQVRAAAGAAAFALGKQPGDIKLEFDLVRGEGFQKLSRLTATRADGAGVTLTAQPDGSYKSDVLQAQLTSQVKVVRGEMDATSFYSSAVSAGIDDSLIDAFANAFSYDFNFATDLHAGDVFEAAFEQKVNQDGDRVGPPTLLYVSITTQAKSKSLYRFLAPGDTEPGWYDGNGRSTITALMRTPVDGARISSPFGMRFHPVLHFNKMHKGTDFAAPIGTPIYAAGTGTILWAAMKGPNGNLTILQHDNGWQTYYLHQSMFMPGVVAGARVTQGQKIGEIGTTGRSTGPHLHFELHVDGQPVDPMGVDTGTGKALSGGGLDAFRKERDRIDVSRSQAAGN